jgi:hypothetical protein
MPSLRCLSVGTLWKMDLIYCESTLTEWHPTVRDDRYEGETINALLKMSVCGNALENGPDLL